MLKIFATLGIAQASLVLLLFIAKSHQRLSMVGRLRRPFVFVYCKKFIHWDSLCSFGRSSRASLQVGGRVWR